MTNPDFYVKHLTTFNVISPYNLPLIQKAYLTRHLEFSCALKELGCIGESIIRGIYNRKRILSISKRRVLRDRLSQQIVKCLRKYVRYEILRSSLEGLMFEQVPYLNEPDEIPFELEGVHTQLMMTHVYFSRDFWDYYNYDQEAPFDRSSELSEGDILLILSFLNNQEALFYQIYSFVDNYQGQDRLKWRRRLYRNIKSVMRHSDKLKSKLVTQLDEIISHD